MTSDADNGPGASGDSATGRAIEPDLFRAVMGGFPTGVAVVTTRDSAGHPVGFTASSVVSVSLDPPLILFCLDSGSDQLKAFSDSGGFAVSFLHAGQVDISARFAGRDHDRFEGVEWQEWETGAPVLVDRAAAMECELEQVVDGGDHTVFFGRVRRADVDASQTPLVYLRGRYLEPGDQL